uniref:Uncharacterized protein n=1 Tax=Corethron hystrix TaxID=216773 RepID=A0A7S1BY91_9STRA|mmetsp:Transcript_5160/g.10435  ORF Transcript_5160/g.10435 Transcript_5160/m.10435 type:complete len:137 (+) Transcript_5160:1519-1929(+)
MLVTTNLCQFLLVLKYSAAQPNKMKENAPPFANRHPPFNISGTSLSLETPMGKPSSWSGGRPMPSLNSGSNALQTVTPPPMPFYNPLGNLPNSENDFNGLKRPSTSHGMNSNSKKPWLENVEQQMAGQKNPYQNQV